MRLSTGLKAATLAAVAGLALTACSTEGADTEATAVEAGVHGADVAEDINTLTGCDAFGGVWAAEDPAEGSSAIGVFTCDADGDGTVETTLSVFASAEDADAAVADVEAASDATAVLQGDTYLVATTDTSHLASISNTEVEVLRELPVAE